MYTFSCMFVDFSFYKAQLHAGYFLQKKSLHAHLVLAFVFFSKLCCVVNAFWKCYFICFWRALHPQCKFATSYFLFWMPCYLCKQRITVLGFRLTARFSLREFCWKCWGIKGIRFGTGYVILLCGQYICSSCTDPN